MSTAGCTAWPACSLLLAPRNWSPLDVCSVFQAFPLESLCCWWGRPGPFWVSMAGRGHALHAWGASPALPLGCLRVAGNLLWNSWSLPGLGIQQSVSECRRRWDSCSVQIARDQLTVAKPQYGSNIVIRSHLLHR